MQTLFNQFSQVMGTTLLHSLWQGFIIYALLRILLLCMPSASAANKYNLALLALAGSVLWPVATLVIQISQHPFIAPTVDIDTEPLNYLPIAGGYNAVVSKSLSFAIDNYMPYIVVLWFTGIILNSARLLWGWRNIHLLKLSAIDLSVLQGSIKKIANLLKITQQVQVSMSHSVNVPCIIGYLKPMIILPVAIATQFSAGQIQSILIHEMGHIRRNDYFVNLVQQVIGIVFFFNPFTQLINRIIYNEREHSCDDLVLRFTGQPLIYAQTLLQLEESRAQNFQLAMAVTGKKNHLLNRIKRIMETKKQVSNIRHILAAVLLLIGSMGAIAWLNPEIKDNKVVITPAHLSGMMSIFNDTIAVAKNRTKNKTAAAIIKSKSKHKANQFEYNDPQLDKLTAEVDKHSQAISKYYDSDDFKKMQDELDKRSADLQAYFDKSEIKDLQAKQEELSREFQSKWGNADEQDNIYAKITALSMLHNKYINTPEYKELDKRLQKKYDYKPLVYPQIPGAKFPDVNNKNYQQYQKELNESMPEDEQKLLAEMKELKKQRKVYNKSPDAQNQELRALADSMRKTFNNPQIKQTEQEMKTLGEAMRAYQNNPEVKKEQQLLKASADKLKAYTNSPAFKNWVEQMKKVEVYRYNNAPKTEKPGKAENPEQEEKPGQIENN